MPLPCLLGGLLTAKSRNYELAWRAPRKSINNEKQSTGGENRSEQIRETNKTRAPHEQFHEALRVNEPVVRRRIDQPIPLLVRTDKEGYPRKRECETEESINHTLAAIRFGSIAEIVSQLMHVAGVGHEQSYPSSLKRVKRPVIDVRFLLGRLVWRNVVDLGVTRG